LTLYRITPEQMQRLLDDLSEDPPEDDAPIVISEGDEDQCAVPASVYRALYGPVESMSDEQFQCFLDSGSKPKTVN
jgi:hypothetical protein